MRKLYKWKTQLWIVAAEELWCSAAAYYAQTCLRLYWGSLQFETLFGFLVWTSLNYPSNWREGRQKIRLDNAEYCQTNFPVLLLFLKHVKFKFYIYIFSAQFAFSEEENCTFFCKKKWKAIHEQLRRQGVGTLGDFSTLCKNSRSFGNLQYVGVFFVTLLGAKCKNKTALIRVCTEGMSPARFVHF